MGNLLNRAVVFATEAHDGQYRKGTSVPYILHPLEAAAIVGTMTADDEVLAAAVLHDVVEDCGVSVERLCALFGERVGHLVAAESENKREGISAESTWKIRKQETLVHLTSASVEVKMIALGDKLSNLRAIARDLATAGDGLWDRFNQKDPSEHAWYYRGIAEAIRELRIYPVYGEYAALLQRCFPSE